MVIYNAIFFNMVPDIKTLKSTFNVLSNLIMRKEYPHYGVLSKKMANLFLRDEFSFTPIIAHFGWKLELG